MHSSSSSSSRTRDSCEDDNPAATNKLETTSNLVIIGCLPLSSLLFFKSTPPTTTTPTNNFQRIVTESSTTLIGTLHNSIDKFLQNPLFTKWHSEYHNFCQMRCRNERNSRSLSNHNFAAIIPGDSVAGLVVSNGVLNFLNIYNTLLVVRLVLTWFPNTPPAIVSPLSTLCDPYLNIFRGVIPPLGGTLDLSPILAFLVLNALTSTASALPAELPLPSTEEGASQKGSSRPSFQTALSHLTSTQKKWMRRFHTNRSNIDE